MLQRSPGCFVTLPEVKAPNRTCWQECVEHVKQGLLPGVHVVHRNPDFGFHGTVYFTLDLELFLDRNCGDHGFSFSALELPASYELLMTPPANRTKASQETSLALSEPLFATSSDFSVNIGDDCQLTELGWKVVDTETYGNGSTTPIGCVWPFDHPTHANTRVGLVVYKELGFVVTNGTSPGTVSPHAKISAFIPKAMTSAQEAQEVWLKEIEALGSMPLLSPTRATGDTRSAPVLQQRAPGHADQCLAEWPKYDIALAVVNVVDATWKG
ncbi:hypothetical protein DV736_g5928, partial [Chaetothyriales sp. CBS 134916]